MKLSTRGRYAARIMVHLARRSNDSPARKQDIAKAEGISADYLEQILVRLKVAGLVVSHRGVGGGFRLARDAGSISIAEVVEAAEGSLELVSCVSGECERAETCVTRELWAEASSLLRKLLQQKTLAELARKADELQTAAPFMYYI